MSDILINGRRFRGRHLTGRKFGRLKVLGFHSMTHGPNGTARYHWNCVCDCGKEIVVEGAQLKRGSVLSCKCLAAEKTSLRSKRHGESIGGRSKMYRVWAGMWRRCRATTGEHWLNYGARGIGVCARWNLFENFKSDMEDTYRDGLTIDRKDNNLGYCPGNCRWSTPSQQQNNKRTTKWLTLGESCFTINEWSQRLAIGVETIRGRLRAGWTEERALTTPPCIKRTPFVGLVDSEGRLRQIPNEQLSMNP